jgi:hypothetical protein
MRVEIQRASNLGALHQTLGIDADSRISFSGFDSQRRCEIWDLTTGNYFAVSAFSSPPAVEASQVAVPDWVKPIIEMPTDQLLAEYKASWQDGDAEERMAKFTELNFRGVSAL